MERILEIAQILKEKDIKYSQLSWVQYTAGYDFGVDEAYEHLTGVYKNNDYFKAIDDARKTELSVADRRRVDLLFKAFEPYHLSEAVNSLLEKINAKTTALSKVLNQHRVIFEGSSISSVEIAQILSKEEDRARRKAAYFARNQVNRPLWDAGFKELLDLRKALATLRGKEDFVSLMLEEDELSPAVFSTWKDEVKKALPAMKEIRQKYAKEFLNDDVIMPWDEAYISSKLAPALNEKVDMSAFYGVLKGFFMKFGIDLSTMNITYDVFPRANKSEWGYNFPVETGVDSRILANVKDRYREYGVLLHETGHGIHSFMTDPSDYLMNMGISGIISEGIANLFGDFLTDELFYSGFFDKEAVKESFERMKEWQNINALRAVHLILFDQELYRRPIESHGDIEVLYYDLLRDLFEEEPFGENPPWAFKIHHTTHPIYLHNYFMGDVTCAMLKDVFNGKYGVKSIGEKSEAFGKFIHEEVILKSGQLPYLELFKSIAVKEFSLSYLK